MEWTVTIRGFGWPPSAGDLLEAVAKKWNANGDPPAGVRHISIDIEHDADGAGEGSPDKVAPICTCCGDPTTPSSVHFDSCPPYLPYRGKQ